MAICAYHNCREEFVQVRPRNGRVSKFCSAKCKNLFYVLRNRQNLRRKAVEYKGGRCQRCEYSKCIKALEFHHRDPTQKDFQICGIKAWSKVEQELQKCDLLCANCHREVHAELESERRLE